MAALRAVVRRAWAPGQLADFRPGAFSILGSGRPMALSFS